MRGPTFYQLHLLLDKHAGEQLELIDTIAERIQTLGGIAVGACATTTSEAPPAGRGAEPADAASLDRVVLRRQLAAHGRSVDRG